MKSCPKKTLKKIGKNIGKNKYFLAFLFHIYFIFCQIVLIY